jgi:cytochrome c556
MDRAARSDPSLGKRPFVQRLFLAALAVAGLVGVHLGPNRAEVQMVGEMHENLAAVNDIVEGVARDDYELVEKKALRLKDSAQAMKELSLSAVGLETLRDSEFDAHLDAMEKAANTIWGASQRKDARGTLVGVQQVFDDGCVPCHRDFRESHIERTPPVLFMRNILSSVQSMNRGLAMNDFTLVAREAREITAVGRVFMWSQVVEVMFGISEPSDRTVFRDYLRQLNSQASRVEGAALERNPRAVTEAVREMWEGGCLPCHQRFRKPK